MNPLPHVPSHKPSVSPVCVVTGGGSGIGLATAHRMRGHRVVLAGRTASTLESAADQLQLEASVRRAGFTPQVLDLAHDVAFAASSLPLGISLSRSTT